VDDAAFLEMEFYKMSFYQRLVKRLGDIGISFLCLVALSPLMGLIALAIKAEDRGPVFFRQKRLTIRGREFTIWKFRTMSVEASLHDSQVSTAVNDSRITRVGHVLRRFRMDEIPQFLNVLRGEMSLVGPRPLVPGELEAHGGLKLYQKVKPGITGWWACNGRSNIDYRERLDLEYYYVKNCSLYLDLMCILRTLVVVITGKGAV
jgi:undecaprenyl-phosphate galactose phosphotransferase